MKYILENNELRVTVCSLGAEVVSVIRKEDGAELAWTADERFWKGYAPLLFPACGGLWNGKYMHEGMEYNMVKHGLVRKREWELYDIDDANDGVLWVVLKTEADDETRKSYPFDYELYVSYSLQGAELNVEFNVANGEDERVMPFQLGGHPSFMLPDYAEGATEPIAYLMPLDHHGMPIDAHCLTIVRASEQGCWGRERFAAPTTEDGLIPVEKVSFAHDAIIIDHDQVSGFTLLGAQKQVLATLRSAAPAFLIWQPGEQLSPFVCIEPWYGLPDEIGHSTLLIERPYTRCVMPQSSRSGELYSIHYASVND